MYSANDQNLYFVLDKMLALLVLLVCCGVRTSQGEYCNNLDRDSLSLFKQSVSGVFNWSISADCCIWEGVGCDQYGRVTSLMLPSRGLMGTISPSITNLSSLSQLSLSHNRLRGTLPDGFFAFLNRLQVLDLSCNLLSGGISANDKLPAAIKMFNLSNNHFDGTIPSSFLQPAFNLEAFDVSNNSFVDSIPSSICNFSSSIRFLDFSNNDFVGPIPQGFGGCSSLQSLRAGFNYFSGRIPLDIYGLSSLQQLYLAGNNLSGPIDERIVNLVSLKILSLYGNSFTGEIPQRIGRLSSLEKLLLHTNKLNGTLPLSLTNCTRLQTLNLRVNSLQGQLSLFDFSKFVHLKSIDLGNNLFTGGLPASLFSCKTLTAIRLCSNSLTGELLPDMVALQSLTFFSIGKNKLNNITAAVTILTGCKNLSILILSKSFYDEQLPGNGNLIGPDGFQNLRVLGLGGCRFSGSFPMWVSRLSKLEFLNLSDNYITGSIPGWVGGLPNLSYLDLSNNRLSGDFPMELTRLRSLAFQRKSDQIGSYYLELPVFILPNNITNLQYNKLSSIPPSISLANNSFNGAIPLEIGQLKFIIALDLSGNNFSGSIPDTLSNLRNLEKVDLSRNQLSGEIPESLGKLHFLSSFSVAYNDLEGPVPTGGQFDTFPSTSFEGNPGLCGAMLQRPCIDLSETVQPSLERESSQEITINWFSFVMGYGVSFVLAVVAVFKFSSW